MKTTYRLAAIGEAMIELSHRDENNLILNFAGDTLNMSTYLARLLDPHEIQLQYITMLGTDFYSEQLLKQLENEHILTHHIEKLADKLLGLYLIRTNEKGDREFYFYRSQSAAREMFSEQHANLMENILPQFNFIYFSAITLAILDADRRERFFQIIKKAKQNKVKIIFDTNYRPALWPDIATTQRVVCEFLSQVDIAFPTFEDEMALFGDIHPEQCFTRLENLGVKEIIIKRGPEPCLIMFEKKITSVAAEKVTKIVDTTSAGDSFNAAYLAARFKGYAPIEAAKYGHQLASIVIQHRGAILDKKNMPRLF